jgi:uncharacterized protein with HEPN domain
MYLEHILESSQALLQHVEGMSKSDFLSDIRTQDAVLRRIEIIGEATKRLTDSVRSEEPDIPWKQIARMRDKVTHDYFKIDLSFVWDTVKQDVPPLMRAVRRILSTLNDH